MFYGHTADSLRTCQLPSNLRDGWEEWGPLQGDRTEADAGGSPALKFTHLVNRFQAMKSELPTPNAVCQILRIAHSVHTGHGGHGNVSIMMFILHPGLQDHSLKYTAEQSH